MHAPTPLILLVLSPLLRLTTALGINCRGSGECNPHMNLELSINVIANFQQAITAGNSPLYIPGGPISDTALYHQGEHVACFQPAFICLFVQGNVPAAGVNGSVIKERALDLLDHGCGVCGSVPLSGDNREGEMGVLTSNYVSEGVGVGVAFH